MSQPSELGKSAERGLISGADAATVPAVELARLDIDPAENRGPDVVHRITVPAAWLFRGGTLGCQLPRKLACARCEGGGCDTCGRSGVVAIQPKEQPDLERVEVNLTGGRDSARAIRVPERGGLAAEPDGCRGSLILELRVGEPSQGVEFTTHSGSSSGGVYRWAMVGLVAVLVVLLYVVVR